MFTNSIKIKSLKNKRYPIKSSILEKLQILEEYTTVHHLEILLIAMGNTDSKLNVLYREHVFKLTGVNGETIPLFTSISKLKDLTLLYQSNIVTDDTTFEQFYLEFVAVGSDLTFEMLNSIINTEELRSIAENNPRNFVNLVRFTALQVHLLANSLSVPSLELLKFRFSRLLGCVRILQKLMPLYLELQILNVEYQLDDIFWTNDPKVLFGFENILDDDDITKGEIVPLGFNLLKSCIQLLFVEGFTIPTDETVGAVSYLLWENGINTQDNTYHVQSPKFDSNRLEIINLLLSLVSNDLYSKQSSKGNNIFLYSLSMLMPEYSSICLIASIINVTCRFCSNYSEEMTNPYKNIPNKYVHQQQLPQLRSAFVLSSFQLLNIICSKVWIDQESGIIEVLKDLNIINEGDETEKSRNIAISYIKTLSREYDLKLILSAGAKIFKYPVEMAIEQESSPFGSFPTRKQSQPYNSHRVNSNSGDQNGNSTQANNSNYIANAHAHTISPHGISMRSNVNDDIDNGTVNSILSLPSTPPILNQILIFFTTMIENNKYFENYFADKFANKFIIFSIYYMNYYNHLPELQSTMLPLCSNLSLFLTSKKLVLSKMLETFTTNYYTNKLPDFFKLTTENIGKITYRDFSVIHLCNVIINDVKENVQPRPYLYEILYNLIQIPLNIKDEELIKLSGTKPEISSSKSNSGLSYNASITLLHLISKLSNKGYLTSYAYSSNPNTKASYRCSPGYKLDLLALLLRSISNYIILFFDESLNLSFALCRHQKVLLQVRDAIVSISKAINNKVSVEGLNVVQENDFFEFPFNPLLLRRSTKTTSNNSTNLVKKWAPDNVNTNGTSIEVLSQHIDLERRLTKIKTSTRNTQVNDDRSLHKVNSNVSTKSYDVNNNNRLSRDSYDGTSSRLDLVKTKSNNSTMAGTNKGFEILEHMDYSTNLVMNNRKVFLAMSAEWPIGMTEKSKAKMSNKTDIAKSWSRVSSFNILIKIVRLISQRFPIINTVNASEYHGLLNEIAKIKDIFLLDITPSLPRYLRESKENIPLKLDISNSNILLKKWMYIICWADTFNSHTGFYNVAESLDTGNQILSGSNSLDNLNTGYSIDSISEVSSIVKPERKIGNGYSLSRTNSNSSSITGYLQNQNQESFYQHPLEFGEMYSASPKSNNIRHKRSSSGGSSSFFGFSWTGFQKNDADYDFIMEEDSDNGNLSNSNPSNKLLHVLDTGLLKPNIWAGTKVRLFIVVREEKKEFSFLDMTSSLLKRFRFNNNSNSTETLHSINTNVSGQNLNNIDNPNGKSLTYIAHRPRTPRSSVNPTFSNTNTPKRF